MGEPKDNDGFIISPSMTKSGAMQFNLNNAEDFAASSKNLISILIGYILPLNFLLILI